jgi:transposase
MSDRETLDVALVIADAVCEISSTAADYNEREVRVRLTEDGMEDYIRELRLQEHDPAAGRWLDEHGSNAEVSDDA